MKKYWPQIVCSIIFIVVLLTSNLVSDSPWVILRVLLISVAGTYLFISFSPKQKPRRYKSTIIPFLILLFISSCSFSGRDPISDQDYKIGNSRIYMDFVGGQGGLGYLGHAIFYEKFIFKGFYKRTELCTNEKDKSQDISFNVKDEHTVECKTGNTSTLIEI